MLSGGNTAHGNIRKELSLVAVLQFVLTETNCFLSVVLFQLLLLLFFPFFLMHWAILGICMDKQVQLIRTAEKELHKTQMNRVCRSAIYHAATCCGTGQMPQLCLSRWSPVSRKRGKGWAGNETGGTGQTWLPLWRSSAAGAVLLKHLVATYCMHVFSVCETCDGAHVCLSGSMFFRH